jgi:hypothetical protein
MANFSRVTTIIVAALVPVVFGCGKLIPSTSTDAGTTTAAASPSTTDASDSGPAASGSAATTAAAHEGHAHAGCAGHQTAFFGTGGTQLCETICSVDGDCKLPATCWGTGNLLNPDGSSGHVEKYCRQPPPDNVCTKPHQTAFFGHNASKICETFCASDAECTAPQTCKGAGQLLDGDGKMGPVEHYCK